MRMKIPIIVVFLALLTLYGVGTAFPEEGKIYVVCDTSIVGSFVKAVGGEYVEVDTIVPPGMCPGHYDIKPSDVAAVAGADIIISDKWPWMESLLTAAGRGSDVLRVVGGPWNTPQGGVSYVKNVTRILCEVDPAHSEYYVKNNASLCEAIFEAASEISARAAELNVSEVKVICMLWQVPFVKWVGFNVAATYGPPEKLSVEDIAKLVETGKKEGVALVIDNLQSGVELGSQIASEIGAQHVVLTNFPGSLPDAPDYVSMLKYNAEQLFGAVERWRVLSEVGAEVLRLKGELGAVRGQMDILMALCIVLGIVVGVESVFLYARRRQH